VCVCVWGRCSSYAEYEDRAVALAHNASRWELLRAAVVRGVLHSPLFDMAAYVGGLERSYQLMWELHAAGLPPRHLKVAEVEEKSVCMVFDV
jgi:protein O-GlcNAc transferase